MFDWVRSKIEDSLNCLTGEGILKTEGSRNRNSAVYCVLIPWKYELDTRLIALAICRVRPCLCWENSEGESNRNLLNCLQTKRISAKYFLVSSELCDALLKQERPGWHRPSESQSSRLKIRKKLSTQNAYSWCFYINTLAIWRRETNRCFNHLTAMSVSNQDFTKMKWQ